MATVEKITLPTPGSAAVDGTKVVSTRSSDTDLSVATEKKRGQGSNIAPEEGRVEAANVEDDFPDGGLRAWLVVVGAFCNAFATVGYVTSWGVRVIDYSVIPSDTNIYAQIFQEYYEKNLLENYSPAVISWIGSIQYALIFMPGLVVGRLFDIGYFRITFMLSSALLITSVFLGAQCTKYWHFLLCQGFASGLGCGGVFSPTHAILSHWFKKKRGLVLGYMAVGASVGGVVLPIAAYKLIPEVGYRWAMRILGFIMVVVLGVSNLTVRRRLPVTKVKGGLLNLAAFKDMPYTIYCLSAFFIFLGIYTFLIYANVSAAVAGISPSLVSYFVALANAGSLFGRWVSGILSDKIGPMNVMIPFTLFGAAFTYAWPFARSAGSLIPVTIIYGFCSGMFVSLMTAPIMSLGNEGDVGRRIGMYMTILAVGALVGPPCSGWIQQSSGGFEMVGIFAASSVALGTGLMAVVRFMLSTKWDAKL
ncbi:MFS general substrate transporter [Macrolepiota fuliginosa MF-IS2]|uniref:MFS general substrate transporter n=1 Tax=Macrolepiota fuliginosa MF-IS2 TaxID=1400762 RepID=A0A9P5XF01_9AGAR|nr:MFS general substrate transporter [Macrolepiota fuliginosa MF-IS2]